ncbi:MAG: hypothetical protein IPK16_08895 [Anaerolineales bacterium]|nr:hypothetical protein [Anaerolineales bacterium]
MPLPYFPTDATPTLEPRPEPDESPTATVDAAGGRATPTATEPVSTPEPPPTATETPRPRSPEAPPLAVDSGNLVSEAQTQLIDVPSGGDVVLKVAELWIAPEGTPSDCAGAFLALSWQVRAPYPGGDELDVRHLIPRGGGNSESLGQGTSGQVTVGICDELTLRNSSLDDYRVQVRYASGVY